MPDAIAASRPSWRPERRSGLDPEIKRLALIAASIGAGAALALSAYGLMHRSAGPIPVVEPDPGPVRVRPADPGGMQVLASGDDVGAPQAAERLAPPPEQPEIALLRAKLRAARHALALAEAAKVAALQKAAAILPLSAAPRPPHGVVGPVLPASLPVPAPVALTPPPSGLAVQLGAFESEAAARAAWSAFAAKAPGVLNGLTPAVLRADLAGRTIWRLRTGNFASMQQAGEFCTRVRDAGGDCSVAAF